MFLLYMKHAMFHDTLKKYIFTFISVLIQRWATAIFSAVCFEIVFPLCAGPQLSKFGSPMFCYRYISAARCHWSAIPLFCYRYFHCSPEHDAASYSAICYSAVHFSEIRYSTVCCSLVSVSVSTPYYLIISSHKYF
jgi:hypothetical protein